MTRGPSWDDINGQADKVEMRPTGMSTGQRAGGRGRRQIRFTCPFCQSDVWAYPWSMAGTGKRCGCGALISYYGHAYHYKERNTA